MARISFFGAASEVTGSCYLLEHGDEKVLIDCGLFQASKFCDERSFAEFPFDPKTIKAVFVTHAHIDHIGRIPRLVAAGFSGAIYSIHPTKALGELMLHDSLVVLQKEHKDHEPIYTEENIASTMALWEGKNYHEKIEVGSFSCTFYRAGHILGSAMALIEVDGKKILFSGDLGNPNNPLLFPAEHASGVDYLIVESTYGDRIHEDMGERRVRLERAIERSVVRGGVLMIPAFSLERTQEMLWEITSMLSQKQVPSVPIYLDSPLAKQATKIYEKYNTYLNKAKTEGSGHGFLQSPLVHVTLSSDESKRINEVPPPKVIIAGSGMSTGGRILHHEHRYLSDPNSTILFIGYQAPGTLGRMIEEGVDTVRIFGDTIPVRCSQEVIQGYSAHADRDALFDFVRAESETVKKIFITHGEPKSSLAFAQYVRDYLGVNAVVPQYQESVEL
jgi:metallo-beta-lactamase family protein